MSKCEYCGSYIEYATATCAECGACMVCWPYECSCTYEEPEEEEYPGLEEEEWDFESWAKEYLYDW